MKEPDPDLIELFVLPLENHGIDYMISGSLASMQYGEPRVTLDVDLVIVLNATAAKAADRFAKAFPISDYYLPPEEVLHIELNRPNRGHFNVIHSSSGLKADCYPSRDHPYFEWACGHRRRIELDGQEVWFAPPEYVILHKLQFFKEAGSEKHLRDIRGMLGLHAEGIDQSMISHASRTLGLVSEWNEAKSQA